MTTSRQSEHWKSRNLSTMRRAWISSIYLGLWHEAWLEPPQCTYWKKWKRGTAKIQRKATQGEAKIGLTLRMTTGLLPTIETFHCIIFVYLYLHHCGMKALTNVLGCWASGFTDGCISGRSLPRFPSTRTLRDWHENFENSKGLRFALATRLWPSRMAPSRSWSTGNENWAQGMLQKSAASVQN